MDELKTITLGELRSELNSLLAMPDDTRVIFGNGSLTWDRLKNRGPSEGPQLMQMSFVEAFTVTP